MSDADVASAFASACTHALIALLNGYQPPPPEMHGGWKPHKAWDELREADTQRLRALAAEVGVTLPAYDLSSNTLRDQIELLLPEANKVAAHYAEVEKNNPRQHALNSLQHLLKELPRLLDRQVISFVNPKKLIREGADERLQALFGGVADLAEVAGIPLPSQWIPARVTNWLEWRHEFERLRAVCSQASNSTNTADEFPLSKQPLNGSNATEYLAAFSWQAVFDLEDTATTKRLKELIEADDAEGGRGTGNNKYRVRIAALSPAEKVRLANVIQALNQQAATKAKPRGGPARKGG